MHQSNDEGLILGKKAFIASTYDGDGVYNDNSGRLYAVDYGCIGILPVSMLKIDNVYTREYIEKKLHPHIGDMIHIIKFDNDFTVECDDGVFTIGDITLDTKHDEEE